jgi:hypothetical protein
MANQEKLMIGVLGGEKSGKTHTWNLLFDKKNVKTGRKQRRLYFDEVTYADVFLISRSAQKRKMDIKSIIKDEDPQIVLCSLQYARKLSNTLRHFVDSGYTMYLHWLNPGYKEPNDIPLFYDSDLVDYILSVPSMLGVRNGKMNADGRVGEIRDFLYGWAKSRGLIMTDEKKVRKIKKLEEAKRKEMTFEE